MKERKRQTENLDLTRFLLCLHFGLCGWMDGWMEAKTTN